MAFVRAYIEHAADSWHSWVFIWKFVMYIPPLMPMEESFKMPWQLHNEWTIIHETHDHTHPRAKRGNVDQGYYPEENGETDLSTTTMRLRLQGRQKGSQLALTLLFCTDWRSLRYGVGKDHIEGILCRPILVLLTQSFIMHLQVGEQPSASGALNFHVGPKDTVVMHQPPIWT